VARASKPKTDRTNGHAQQQQIVAVPIAQLVPYTKNPRSHPPQNVEKLAASLKEYGWTSPVLITGANEIIAGHGRVLAATKLGITSVPCIRLEHLTREQVKAYRIADNRLGIDSDWDLELLKLELNDLDLDVALTGFDADELDRILNGNGAREGEDDTPALQETVVSQLGEIWALGPHRLFCGDAIDAVGVARLLAGVTPSVMVTDPPYGVEYDPAWRTAINENGQVVNDQYIKNDRVVDWSPSFESFNGDVIYVWHAALHCNEVAQGIQRLGFILRNQIIWVKNVAGMSRGHYSWQHEPCWYGIRKGKTAKWSAKSRYESTVWQIDMIRPTGDDVDKQRTNHAAQKPVECMRRPIFNHTSEGHAVYDPFMGSGTTIIAAETINRVCYGVEINPLYVDMAIRRWQTFTGKTATRLGDGKAFDG
jgi:DNA modification methylase